MKSIWLGGATAAAIAVAALAVGFAAGSHTAVNQSAPVGAAADRGEIERIVREYLVANPEVMIEVQTALQAKQEEARRVSQLATIDAARDHIFNAAYDGVIGNPDGKQTIVEFFDYNCGYCKRALDDMDKMIEANPDLRFVLKEFPILGPESHKASVVSMAFRTLAPEKYGEFHRELLSAGGRAGEEKAIAVAIGLGVDEATLRAEMKNPEIEAAFAKTYELANSLSITGTPSYVVGDEVVFGAMGVEALTEKVQNLTN